MPADAPYGASAEFLRGGTLRIASPPRAKTVELSRKCNADVKYV